MFHCAHDRRSGIAESAEYSFTLQVFYFANRYFLLFALIGMYVSAHLPKSMRCSLVRSYHRAVALNVTKEVNCQALYTYNQVFGNASIGLASINLSLRT